MSEANTSRLRSEWTENDVKTLKACARAKIPARIAARKLRRSRGAVAFKAMTLGIHFRAIRQPPGAQRKANRTKRQRAAA